MINKIYIRTVFLCGSLGSVYCCLVRSKGQETDVEGKRKKYSSSDMCTTIKV